MQKQAQNQTRYMAARIAMHHVAATQWAPPPAVLHYKPSLAADLQELNYADLQLLFWIWTDDNKGKPVTRGMAIQGKALKPLWNYRFKNEAQRDQMIAKTLADRKLKVESMSDRVRSAHDYAVGDILVCSWGYNQTQANFFSVVATTDKAIKMREIDQKVVRQTQGLDYVMPIPGHFIGPVLAKMTDQTGRVRINSFSSAHKWNGKPEQVTAAGYGH